MQNTINMPSISYFVFGNWILASLLAICKSEMYDFEGMSTLPPGDDDASLVQNIPGGFPFFGVQETQLYVSKQCILKTDLKG